MAAGGIEVLSVVLADGTRIGCEVGGAGLPLLLVHGSTADRSRWATVRDALAARFTLRVMDRRGRGLSVGEAPGPYALAREAEDVAAVLAAIGPDALVLGHSYGGTCVLAATHTLAREAREANAFSPAGGEVGAPVRFLLGTESAPPLVRATMAAHASVPGSSVRELPGQGHAAMDTAPELFVAEVAEWLSP